ncbi:DUF3930 family protein [Ectobacillus panaciterrae]|uniref:DUF3930 family protein n=1 Tax=Ectobacillus panaciterrae TaxID=363872 RepID=UPI00041466D8|nr:DUF3930 family protein [Ectobacillus panaciterrae]
MKEREKAVWETEEKSLFTFCASEQFDRITAAVIKGLLIFLTIVGIPYTMYMLYQLLISL